MADDQNRSGKGDQNRTPDYIDQSSVFTRAEEIRQQQSLETLTRSELKRAIADAREEHRKLRTIAREMTADPNVLVRETPYYRERAPELRQKISRSREELKRMDIASTGRAESEMRTFLSREYSESYIGGRVANLSRAEQVQNQSFSYAGRTFDELEAEKQDLMARVRQSKRLAIGQVAGMYRREQGSMITDPDKISAIEAETLERDKIVRQIAQISIAQKAQRTAGTDPTSRLSQLLEKGEEAKKIISTQEDQRLISADKIALKGDDRVVSRSQIDKEIIAQSSALVKALKELEEAAKNNAGNLNELREKAQNAADNLEKLQTASRGGGGFGGVSAEGWGRFGSYMQMAAIASDTTRKIFVQDEIQSMRNISGYASIENQKYNQYRAARGGDVASQLALAQYASAEEFARRIKITTGATEAISGYAGGAAKMTAGAAAIGMAPATGPLAVAAGLGGKIAIAQGAADLATTTSGLVRGISTGQAYQAGVGAYMEALHQVNAIPAMQMQGLRDLYVGAGGVGIGMGAGAERFLNQITGRDVADRRRMESRQGLPLTKTLLERTAELGIGPEQLVQLSQTGVNAMGGQFDVRQVEFAKRLELSNLGSAQQNMMRMGQLTAAGANNPQTNLEAIMATAVEKGLNSSKAINTMVENTAAMAAVSGTAAAGLDSFSAVAGMTGSLVNANIENKEFAAAHARTVQELAMSSATNTSVTFSGMLNTSRTSQLAEQLGLDPSRADVYAKAGPAFYKSLLDPTNAANMVSAAQQKGINLTDPEAIKKFARGMLDIESRAIFEASGAGLASEQNIGDLYKKVRSAKSMKDLSSSDIATLGTIAVRGKYDSATDLFNATNMVFAEPNTRLDLSKTAGKTADEIQKLRIDGDKQLAEAAASAAKSLNDIAKGAGDALDVFSELTAKFSKGGAEREEGFSTAGADAAKSFGQSTQRFDATVSRLEATVNALASRAGLGATVSPRPSASTPTVPVGRPTSSNPGQEW